MASPADPLGCEAEVFDPAGILSGARLDNPVRLTEQTLHARGSELSTR
jgi:hypothetical protein